MMISVIVPIYNAEKYLENCIQSICDQTYSELEILLIDDGSSDASLAICRERASKDHRIKVFHQDNQGQGAARNVGLQHATGTYIMFVDSDDALAVDTLAENIKILQANREIDCLQFPVHMKYGAVDAYVRMQSERLYWDNLKTLILCDGIISWIVCDKIFRKDVLHNKVFRTDIKYEDNYLMMQLIKSLKNVYISEKGMYYYFQREASTTTSAPSELKERSTIEVLHLILHLLLPVDDNQLFYKYLIRLVNVEKSLRVNFKAHSPRFSEYAKFVQIYDVLKYTDSWKDKIKLIHYKYR